MKFWLAVLVYGLMALGLGLGILHLMKGNPWLLITSALIYAVIFARIGCLPKRSH